MTSEVWELIPYSPNYEVSNHGNIRNTEKGNVLMPRPTAHNYLRVHLPMGTGRKDMYIHRIVADVFCDHPVGHDVVNHIDNDPTNNHADNLEWTTQLKNVHYGMKQKRYLFNAVPVVGIIEGKEHKFISARQAAKSIGCDHSLIIKCCKGKRKSTHGYKWKYAEVI